MTSSYRATGAASVRQTPAIAVANAGVWTLSELALQAPRVERQPKPAEPVVTAESIAEERSRWIDEGYARGLADGERKAANEARAQIDSALGAIREATERVHEVATLAPNILEENIAALAVVVARQIVAREVSLDRELVADLVRRALTEFPIDQSVRIRVNPLDLAVMTLKPGETGSASPITASRDASWLADARVSRGGCLVEGRDRIIDGRVDTALERAYRRMSESDA